MRDVISSLDFAIGRGKSRSGSKRAILSTRFWRGPRLMCILRRACASYVFVVCGVPSVVRIAGGGAILADFYRISAVLSVRTRQRKRCAAESALRAGLPAGALAQLAFSQVLLFLMHILRA